MIDCIRRTEFLLYASDVNANFFWLKERFKELKKDMNRLESESRELKDRVRALEISQATLRGGLR